TNGAPRYAARAQKSARDASRVRYMNVNAQSHTDEASAIAANASVTREMRRRRTLAPDTIISNAVTDAGSAAAKPAWETSTAILDRSEIVRESGGFCRGARFLPQRRRTRTRKIDFRPKSFSRSERRGRSARL